jgi:predicted  nucleic acid-binding Zn-ribbon protein
MLREAMPAPYKAFLEQYEKLNGVIPDESLRFKAALATSNCIREDILKAIDTGLGTMAKALQDFQRAYESKKNNIEQALKQGTATVTEGIRAKNAQIQALQAEVQQLEQSLRQSEVKAQAEQAGLDNVRAGFEAAHAQVVRFLEMQRQQMPGGV